MITSHPRCTADRGRSALPKTVTQRETGNRRIGWGHYFQVSGLGRLVPSSGVQVRVQVQEICHLSSVIDAAIFPFRVAGGGPGWRVAGLIHSALNSVLNAVLHGQPRQARAARGAAPTPRQSLPRYSILHTRYSRSSSSLVLPPRPKPSFLSLRESPAPHRI